MLPGPQTLTKSFQTPHLRDVFVLSCSTISLRLKQPILLLWWTSCDWLTFRFNFFDYSSCLWFFIFWFVIRFSFLGNNLDLWNLFNLDINFRDHIVSVLVTNALYYWTVVFLRWCLSLFLFWLRRNNCSDGGSTDFFVLFVWVFWLVGPVLAGGLNLLCLFLHLSFSHFSF